MRSFLKAAMVAGLMVFSLAAFSNEAQAEPVVASWYGPGFEGALTASGEPFNPYAYTAAHPYLPFGTQLQVCYQGCVVVTVNDRGPFVGGRGLDLSQAAAQAIGLTGPGVAVVDAQVVGQQPYAATY
ncbi:septal ring lytic transglycosylase RlpA family protein [Rubrobacter taiwanensis]|nr:septal ring lytic transglycosylase RlpA family protein [Rubrobacter taiwanensis]